MVFMGQPPLSSSGTAIVSKIDGDVYTEWENRTDYGDLVEGYGLGVMSDPAKVLANIEARAGYQPALLPYHPLIVGMTGVFNPTIPPKEQTFLPNEDEPVETFYSYNQDDWPLTWGSTERFTPEQPVFRTHQTDPTIVVDAGNALNGNFFYDHELDVEIGPSIVDGSGPNGPNEFSGDIHLRRAPLRDPLENIQEPDFAGFTPLEPEEADGRLLTYASGLIGSGGLDPDDYYWNDDDGAEPFLLTETLRLTETENSLSPGGPVSPHYLINGSISNRQSIFHKSDGSLHVRETFAGLQLEGVTLVVDGDLDLGASAIGRPIPISGTGSTLVVKGQLTLGNAYINAGDQGFVIYADDIVLKGGGDFFGLMIAKNSITVLSQDESPLKVQGGIMCAGEGGVTLRGAEVKHEPRYLKGINGAGEFSVTSWKKL